MRKKLLALVVLLLAGALPSLAATTDVSAVVADANGNLYSNGRYSIVYQAGATLQTGVSPTFVSGVLNQAAELAVTLFDNSTTGSTYQFNICAQAGNPCFSVAITITGSTQTITTTLAAAAASLTNTTPRTTLTLGNQVAPVATPVSGNVVVYSKTSDKKLYYKNDAGTEVGPLASTTGGTPAFSAITAGTNAAALVVGTGGSLTVSGSGTINATTLGSATFAAPGAIGGGTPAAITGTALTGATYSTSTNCSDSAGAAACAAAAAGAVVVDAVATSVVVSTTAVTANSEIFLQFDSSLGTRLGITCNTTAQVPAVTARTAATSFTVTIPSGPVTNPLCLTYRIVN